MGALEVLGHHIVWSLLFLVGVLGMRRQWSWLRPALADRAVMQHFIASAADRSQLVHLHLGGLARPGGGVNLGYFISPLVNVLTGWLVLKRRLRPGAVAGGGHRRRGRGLADLDAGRGAWIALALAATFASYGLLRKTASLGRWKA